MAVTPADIEKMAKLARIAIDENESAPLTERLNTILSLVDKLQAAETSGVEPMANPHDACQRLRPDVVTEGNMRDQFLAIAPQTEQGLFLVPKVLE